MRVILLVLIFFIGCHDDGWKLVDITEEYEIYQRHYQDYFEGGMMPGFYCYQMDTKIISDSAMVIVGNDIMYVKHPSLNQLDSLHRVGIEYGLQKWQEKKEMLRESEKANEFWNSL